MDNPGWHGDFTIDYNYGAPDSSLLLLCFCFFFDCTVSAIFRSPGYLQGLPRQPSMTLFLFLSRLPCMLHPSQARMIRELKEELEELRNRVGSGGCSWLRLEFDGVL